VAMFALLAVLLVWKCGIGDSGLGI